RSSERVEIVAEATGVRWIGLTEDGHRRQGGTDELPFGREASIHGRLRNAGARSDPFHGKAPEPLVGEELQGLGEDRRVGLGAARPTGLAVDVRHAAIASGSVRSGSSMTSACSCCTFGRATNAMIAPASAIAAATIDAVDIPKTNACCAEWTSCVPPTWSAPPRESRATAGAPSPIPDS